MEEIKTCVESVIQIGKGSVGDYCLIIADIGPSALEGYSMLRSYLGSVIDRGVRNIVVHLNGEYCGSDSILPFTSAHQKLAGKGSLEVICDNPALNAVMETCGVKNIIRCHKSLDEFKFSHDYV